jgi:MYXO-CTERM domain-containing protein
MKKLVSLFAMFVLAAGLTAAQSDQPATSTDNNKPSQADRAATNEPVGQRSDNRDFGWIGLLGLAGLAGLRRRREVHEVRPTTSTYSDQENLRRAV